MEKNEYLEELGKPFDVSDVSWKIQRTTKDKTRGLAVPYLDARAISDRLDSVLGQNNWRDAYTKWHSFSKEVRENGKEIQKGFDSQLCTIYVYDSERKEWIGKTDGAENTDFESIKGGISDSFKRAAVKWNVGRYLYAFEAQWVTLEEQYGRQVITEAEIKKLEKKYLEFIAKIFGADNSVAGKNKPTTNPKSGQEKPKSDKGTNEKADKPQTNVYEVTDVRVNRDGDKNKADLLFIKMGIKILLL